MNIPKDVEKNIQDLDCSLEFIEEINGDVVSCCWVVFEGMSASLDLLLVTGELENIGTGETLEVSNVVIKSIERWAVANNY